MKYKVFFLVILMMALAIPHRVIAYNCSGVAPSGQMLYYYINGSTASVTYHQYSFGASTYYPGLSGDLIIPDSIVGYPVTSIDSGCFRGCSGLTSITIPATISHVGNGILNGCSNLSRIIIKSRVWLDPYDDYTWFCGALDGIPSNTEIIVPCGQMYGYMYHCAFANRNVLSDMDTSINIGLTAVYGTMSSTECINVFRHDSVFFNLSYSGYISDITWSVKRIFNGNETTLFTDNSNQTTFSLSANVSMNNAIDSILVECHASFIGCSTIIEKNKSVLIKSFPENMHDTVYVHDTIFLYDTIYIHDTIVVGINDVDAINAKIYISKGQIVVEGADGNTVTLYDVSGRMLATKRDDYMPLRLDVPASGTYMVKIGDYPARRVVVIK